MKLDGLEIGQPGYTALLVERIAPLALSLESMFRPAMIAGVASPSRWLDDRAGDGGAFDALIALIDHHFGRYTAFVAYANSSYVHASRIDAVETMMQVRSSEALVALLHQTLEDARAYAMLEAIPGVPIVPSVPLSQSFTAACAALGEVMAAYFGFQRQVVRFDRHGGADDRTRARTKTAVQAVHRALGDILEIPASMPHADPGRLVNAQAGSLATAGLLGIAHRLDQQQGPEAAPTIAAATRVQQALAVYLERAEVSQRALLSARAAYLALGRRLDRIARRGTERFASELVLAAQTREVLEVERGVRAAFGSPEDWDQVTAQVDAACADRGLEPPAPHRDAFAAVRQHLLRYEGGVGSFEINFGAIDRALGEFFGSIY